MIARSRHWIRRLTYYFVLQQYESVALLWGFLAIDFTIMCRFAIFRLFLMIILWDLESSQLFFDREVLGARGGSATRDEVHTMLSRLPDHGIVINFHIIFIMC